MALQFGIDDEVLLWDSILEKVKGNTSSVGKLLVYADVYSQPERFIDAYPEDVTLGEISKDLDEMFRKMSIFQGLKASAVTSGERAKWQAQERLLKRRVCGYTDIENDCCHCHQDLVNDPRDDTLVN